MENINENRSINQRTQTNEEEHVLHQENETLRAIINSLSEGVIVADRNGEFLFFNPVAERILGIGARNIAPDEWTSIYGCYYPDETTPYPPEQLPLARAIRGEEVKDELIFIKNPERPEGIWISTSASPMRDSNCVISGGVVIFHDISDSKRAEIELRQIEERLKAQFKGIPIPTYVWQKVQEDFVLIDFNNAAEVITRDCIEKLLGIKVSKMYANSPDIQADFLRCFDEKMTIRREMSYRLQTTGECKELNISYVFAPPDLILVHTEDVTERKQTEKELRKLSNAVEQTADSIVITNKHGIIEYVNPAFETTTGFKCEEALGQTPRILKSGAHDTKFYHNLWSKINNGMPFRGTIINKKKNGEHYWCEQTITPMKDENGNINNFVSVLKDITELKKRQEHEFQLSLAHEVQQQLYNGKTSIPGFDIAGATYPAVETNGDYYDFISTPDGCLWIVIGDVTGHGIGAALIMTETRAYLRAFAKMDTDPGAILTRLNQELVADLDGEHFVTLILARLDPHERSLIYASAGHVSAFLLNQSGETDYIMESTGIPLGFMPDYEYEKSKPIKLVPENIAVFLTDGIIEAEAPDETEFGFDRTLDLIKCHQHTTANQIVERLYQAVRSFSENQPQEDDVTSVICKVNPIG